VGLGTLLKFDFLNRTKLCDYGWLRPNLCKF